MISNAHMSKRAAKKSSVVDGKAKSMAIKCTIIDKVRMKDMIELRYNFRL